MLSVSMRKRSPGPIIENKGIGLNPRG